MVDSGLRLYYNKERIGFRGEMIQITVKEQVKAACDVAGISVTELGKRMGMSQANISSRLSVGKFSKKEYEQMAEILGAKFVFRF